MHSKRLPPIYKNGNTACERVKDEGNAGQCCDIKAIIMVERDRKVFIKLTESVSTKKWSLCEAHLSKKAPFYFRESFEFTSSRYM